MNSYEWSRASVAQFIVAQTPNADERPLNYRKHSRYKFNISPLSYAMLSGLSEILLCTYRSFDSIIVYAKPPFAGSQQALDYLGRYTHRVALSNNRLIAMDDDNVQLRWKDCADDNQQKVMTIRADEFIRRFFCIPCPLDCSVSATTASLAIVVALKTLRA
jgi:hypothetical protein